MPNYEHPQPTGSSVAVDQMERPHELENRFARTSSGYRQAIMARQNTMPADPMCPDVYRHIYEENDDLFAIESAILRPGEFAAKPTHPKYRTMFETLGVLPAGDQHDPRMAARQRFLRIATNPDWGKYPQVQYRNTDSIPVAFTSAVITPPDAPIRHFVSAIGSNSSVVVLAEQMGADAVRAPSEMVVLYDAGRQLLNPNNVDAQTFGTMRDIYLAQADAFLNAIHVHGPTPRTRG